MNTPDNVVVAITNGLRHATQTNNVVLFSSAKLEHTVHKRILRGGGSITGFGQSSVITGGHVIYFKWVRATYPVGFITVATKFIVWDVCDLGAPL